MAVLTLNNISKTGHNCCGPPPSSKNLKHMHPTTFQVSYFLNGKSLMVASVS